MLEDIIDRARRRLILGQALTQVALCGMIVAGGLVLLLLAGTRWIEWWTIPVLAGAVCAIAIIRLRRTIPSRYDTAVCLDHGAQLNDSLSTAIHFNASPNKFAALQRQDAETVAAAVDIPAAIPLRVPSSLYVVVALLLSAAGLVVIRYRITHSLDLHAPLTEVFFEDQAAHRPLDKRGGERDAARRKQLETAESLLARMGIPLSPENSKAPDALDKAIEQALSPPSAGSSDKGQKGEAAGKTENGRAGNGTEAPKGDPMDEKSPGQPGDDGKNTASDKGTPKAGGKDSASLLSKLKDAVSNIFSKASENKNTQAQKTSGDQQSQSRQGEKGKSDKAGGKGQQEDNNSADAQDGELNGDPKDGQPGQAAAQSKNSQNAGQAGSGAGSQDGSKDMRAAEQLKAMGKISEIIGKRAATVSGETMIEVQSGNQKLTTAYSSKAAAHNETDGDVSRDQIPVGLQPYVREYFERVRKPATAKLKPAQ